jgi:hypothetical protein
MSRPEGMPIGTWQRIGKLPSDTRDRVLERAAILIYEAGLSPSLADERALVLEGVVAPTLPGVE